MEKEKAVTYTAEGPGWSFDGSMIWGRATLKRELFYAPSLFLTCQVTFVSDLESA